MIKILEANEEMAETSCTKCSFYLGGNECQLPTNKPTASMKSAREHYKKYFGYNCDRIEKWLKSKQTVSTTGK